MGIYFPLIFFQFFDLDGQEGETELSLQHISQSSLKARQWKFQKVVESFAKQSHSCFQLEEQMFFVE